MICTLEPRDLNLRDTSWSVVTITFILHRGIYTPLHLSFHASDGPTEGPPSPPRHDPDGEIVIHQVHVVLQLPIKAPFPFTCTKRQLSLFEILFSFY